MNSILALLGRVLMAAVFLGSAWNKVTSFGQTTDDMAKEGLPVPALLLVGAVAFEVVGGLMLAVGYRARLGALLLIAFLVPVTLIYHFEPGVDRQMQQFMKNLAILGGLVFVLAQGSGGLAYEGKTKR